jgi:hypothetical protein
MERASTNEASMAFVERLFSVSGEGGVIVGCGEHGDTRIMELSDKAEADCG